MVCAFRSDERDVRVVTNVERNAVDVEVPIDVRHSSRTAKSCGSGAPMQALKFATMLTHRADDGGKRWFTGKSTK